MTSLPVFGMGPAVDLSTYEGTFKAFKKPIPLKFEFAAEEQDVQTLEGKVHCVAGDAIMTGIKNEHWPIPRGSFEKTYDFDPDTGLASKKKIVVCVRQMDEPFKVKVSWSDDLLVGEPGDYLVEYGSNDFGTVKEEIFAATYQVAD